MNLNLKNRSIFTKILLGFIFILILAGIMGAVLFYSLNGVNNILLKITERNAPSIRYSTGVERYALRTILDEKNYLLLEKKEIHEKTMMDIQEIYANLDKVDEVATKYNDKALLQKSKDVRRAVEEYQGYYNQGVALLKENQVLAHKMRMLGRKVNNLSHTYTIKHKRLLEEAIADGIDQTKYMESFYLCNKIEKGALEVRRQEKNCLLYKDEENYDILKKNIANLQKLYIKITEVDFVLEHQSLMKETRMATDEYLAAAEKWVANDNELKKILALMHEIGIKVQETARAVQEIGWQEMQNSKKAAMLTTHRTFLISTLISVITIVMGIIGALFIARGIAGPVRELTRASDRIAGGDLSQRVVIDDSVEVGKLSASFNTMVENLQNSMAEIRREKSFSKNIITTVPESLLVIDKDLRIKSANRSFYKTFQIKPENIIGTSISEILGDRDGRLSTELTGLFGTEDILENFELHYQSKKAGERIFNIFARGIIIAEEEEEEEEELVVLQDITERKKAELALKVSRESFHNIVEKNASGIIVTDRNGIICFINPAVEVIFNRKAEELVGDLFGFTLIEGMVANIDIIRKGGATGIGEMRATETEWENKSAHLIMINDITERVQAEEGLRQSKAYIENIIGSMIESLVVTDWDGNIRSVNYATCQLSGYAEEELIGNSISMIFAAEEEEEVFKVLGIGELIKNGFIRNVEKTFQLKNGRSIPVLFSGSIMRGDNDEFLGIVCVTEDITIRKQIEESLKTSETNFRQIIENSNNAIYVQQDDKFILINPAFKKLVEYSEEELTSPDFEFLNIVSAESKEFIIDRDLKRQHGESSPNNYEFKALSKSGKIMDFEVNVSEIIWNGKPARLGIIRDLTEHHQLQEMIIKSEKLKTVGVLAGGIAHNFNNILAVFLGNAQLAKMKFEKGEDITEYLTTIEKTTVRATAITKQLLTFSKGDAPIIEAVSSKELIEETVSLTLTGRNIGCIFNINDDILALKIDKGQISQVIINIVLNAVQAMPEGGNLYVSGSNVQVDKNNPVGALKEGNYVKVSIKDEGIGIPDDIIKNIFDPFFSTNPAVSEGLGLAICYSIIQKHDGYITLISKVGVGSTFTFYLPASDKVVEKKEIKKEVKKVKEVKKISAHILVMDDQETVREVMIDILQAFGCEVESATNGQEAILKYKQAKEKDKPFHLVIFDLIVSGGMGGVETVKELKFYDENVKAIAYSGYADDPVICNPEKYGFVASITKPFQMNELSEILKNVL